MDYEAPAAYTETTRNARKPHQCCECYGAIEAGGRYVYVSGVWDGRGDSFAYHECCMDARRELLAEMESGEGLLMEGGIIEELHGSGSNRNFGEEALYDS